MTSKATDLAADLAALISEGDINGYNDDNLRRKERFHLGAKNLLTAIAKDLGLSGYSIYSNRGGQAVGGEVSLTTDEIKIQIFAVTSEGYKVDGQNIFLLDNRPVKSWAFYQLHHMSLRELHEDYEASLNRFRQFIKVEGK